MKYNFDETLDHRYDGSIRWEQPDGRDDVIGMGTADMDFVLHLVLNRHCSRSAEKTLIIIVSNRTSISSL